MSTVAINIVTYNNASTIQECLECIQKQTYRKFSVFVIDNASTDNTVFLCKRFKIQLIRNTTNFGYAAAHNQGICLTKSKYILTLNPDVFLRPDFLQQMVSVLERNTRLGSACGLLLRIDHTKETPMVIDGAGLFMRKNRRQGLLYEGKPAQSTLQADYILGPDGAAAFYRRKMLEDIAINQEMFDEDFFMHKEDVDIAWRAQRAGWSSIFIPKAVAYHIRTFRPGKRKNISNSLRCISLRNRYLLLIKNDNWNYITRDILYIVTYELGIFLYILFVEQHSLRAYISASSLWKIMMRKRRYIQRRWPNHIQNAYNFFLS